MILKNLFTLLFNHVGCILSRYLKNATNNISGMFYLRISTLRHKIMQDNFEAVEAEAIGKTVASASLVAILRNFTCSVEYLRFGQVRRMEQRNFINRLCN